MTRVTVREIAALAGVSAMTVSNVIQGKSEQMSCKTREKILDLIDKYNYVPNQNASSLKSSSSNLIGILLYNKREFLDFTDPFVSSILTGASDEAKKQGFFLMVDVVKSPQDIDVLQRNWRFAGFIVVGVEVNEQEFLSLDEAIRVPVTYVDAYFSDKSLFLEKPRSFVHTDEEGISKHVAQYLMQKGHKKVLCYSFTFESSIPSVMEKRVKFFEQYFDGEILFEYTTSSDYQEILKSVEAYLKNQPFTAIYATADILALKLNRIFQDISIMGVDDAPMAEFMNPKLTTVAINQVKKGEEALTNLIMMIKESKICDSLLPSHLVERDSVKKVEE